jgi:hypothetical protein
MAQVHLATQSHTLNPCFVNNPTPSPSTEVWNLVSQSGHLKTHATTYYPHSSLHPQSGIPYYASILT